MLCFDDGDDDKNAKKKENRKKWGTERRMLGDMKVVTAKEGEKEKNAWACRYAKKNGPSYHPESKLFFFLLPMPVVEGIRHVLVRPSSHGHRSLLGMLLLVLLLLLMAARLELVREVLLHRRRVHAVVLLLPLLLCRTV